MMNTKKIFSLLWIATAFVGMMSMSACRSHEDNSQKGYQTPEQRLAKTFYDTYGNIATSHPWHNAAKYSLNVTLPVCEKNITVSIYTADPSSNSSNAIKLAEYADLQPSQTHVLKFEGIGGLQEVYLAIQAGGNTNVTKASLSNASVKIDAAPSDYTRLYSTDMQYIIAFEDLGVAIDMDYNDFVLGVTRVMGTELLKVRIWAVGSTVCGWAYYDKQMLFEQRELHDRVGISTSTTMNTFASGNLFTVANRKASKYQLDVYPELQQTVKVDADFSVIDNLGAFKIMTAATTSTPVDEQKTSQVPTKLGQCPFAIMIADPYWEWPTEKTEIGKAYSDFASYVANPALYKWY